MTSHVGFNGQIAIGGGKMFWSNSEEQKVFSANVDGSNIQVVSALGGVSYDGGIAVDPFARHIYWGDTSLHKILMANFDGTNKSTIYSAPSLYPMGIGVVNVPEPASVILASIGMLTWSVISMCAHHGARTCTTKKVHEAIATECCRTGNQ